MYTNILSSVLNDFDPSIYSLIKKKFPNAKLFARGWRSIIFEVNGKILKVYKMRRSFEREKYFLLKLSNLPFVPKVFEVYPEIPAILMEKVEGKSFGEIILRGKRREVRISVKMSMLISIVLDLLKIYNPEMNRPLKHIIFPKEDFPKLIDYERFKEGKIGNFTQLVSFLFLNGGRYSKRIWEVYGKPKKDDLIRLLKKYKKEFPKILSLF